MKRHGYRLTLYGLLALGVSNCLAAEQTASTEPLTIAQLEETKVAFLERDSNAYREFVETVKLIGPESEKAILVFLEQEFTPANRPQKERDLDRLDRLYDLIVEQLPRIGTKASVAALPKLIASHEGHLEYPHDLGEALVLLSKRISVKQTDLAPVFQSPNADIAAFGKSIWSCITYTDIARDIPGLLSRGMAWRNSLERQVGKLDDWQRLASERGFSVLGGVDQGKELAGLIADSQARVAKLSAMAPTEVLSSTDIRHLAGRERLLILRAIEALQKTEPETTFDILVELLAGEDLMFAWLASYQLYKLTGEHFPIQMHIDYKNARTNIPVPEKAAAAWQAWQKERRAAGKGVAGADPSRLAVEERVARFQADHRDKKGQEFARETSDILEELESSDDKRILNMLSEVLASRTLSAADVSALIDRAESTTAETKKFILYKTLVGSKSDAALKYLAGAVDKDMPEDAAVAFLGQLGKVGDREFGFLTDLYAAHPSAAVKDKIFELFIGQRREYHHRSDQSTQKRFITWLIRNPSSDAHKIAALRRGHSYPGVNKFGRTILDEFLGTTEDPELRKAGYLLLVEDRGDDGLERILKDKAPDDVLVEGLGIVAGQIRAERGVPSWTHFSDGEKLLANLRLMADTHDSSQVKKAARTVLDRLLQKELDQLLERQISQTESIRRNEAYFRTQGVQADELAAMRQMFLAGSSAARYESELRQLKKRYGPIPNEDELKQKMAAHSKEAADALEELLKNVKVAEPKQEPRQTRNPRPEPPAHPSQPSASR